MRAVIDTGVLVSTMIKPAGAIGEVLHALRNGQLTTIYSTDILVEIIEVLGNPAFRTKYHIMPEDITALVNLVRLRSELVTPHKKISTCRDPKYNKFLEAALAGEADCIVSGDADLLALTPFEDIPILRPAEVLAKL